MRVGIIGANGSMGQWFMKYFASKGYEMTLSDPSSDELLSLMNGEDARIVKSNVEVVRHSDFIMLAVPTDVVSGVLQEIAPHLHQNSIICEISSLKEKVIDVVERISQTGVKVLSLHPLFGPGADYNLMRIALIPVSNEQHEMSLASMIFPEASIVSIAAPLHDRAIMFSIGLSYFVNLMLLSVIKDEDLHTIQQLSGTTFRVQTILAGAILHQPAFLHMQLFKGSIFKNEIIGKLQETMKKVCDLIFDSDFGKFSRFYISLREDLDNDLNMKEQYDQMYRLLMSDS